jgi:hypothetical protein
VDGVKTIFLPQQPALDAARMYLNLESLADGLGQLLCGQGSICNLLLSYELHNLAGQLVAALRTPLERKQAKESALLKGCLRLIERRAGKPEGARGFADGAFVDVDMAQHLVLDLHQVVGIEEVAVLEQRIGDGFRMWVESAVTAKRLAFGFGIGRWQRGHGRKLL